MRSLATFRKNCPQQVLMVLLSQRGWLWELLDAASLVDLVKEFPPWQLALLAYWSRPAGFILVKLLDITPLYILTSSLSSQHLKTFGERWRPRVNWFPASGAGTARSHGVQNIKPWTRLQPLLRLCESVDAVPPRNSVQTTIFPLGIAAARSRNQDSKSRPGWKEV